MSDIFNVYNWCPSESVSERECDRAKQLGSFILFCRNMFYLSQNLFQNVCFCSPALSFVFHCLIWAFLVFFIPYSLSYALTNLFLYFYSFWFHCHFLLKINVIEPTEFRIRVGERTTREIYSLPKSVYFSWLVRCSFHVYHLIVFRIVSQHFLSCEFLNFHFSFLSSPHLYTLLFFAFLLLFVFCQLLF